MPGVQLCRTGPGEAPELQGVAKARSGEIRLPVPIRPMELGYPHEYRPEAAGLATAIFNADLLKDEVEDHIILVEGEFKAMVLSQNGLPAISIPGASIFKDKWLKLFPAGKVVYVALDPGAEAQALKIAKMLGAGGVTTRLITHPVKPDDFFTRYSGTLNQFYTFLQNGRKLTI